MLYSHYIKQKVRLREFLLKKLLCLIGFVRIVDHWVYLKRGKKNAIVLDLGANRGAFSYLLRDKFGAKCYAVEPNNELYLQLDDTISKLNYAVAKTDGHVEFYVSKNNEASSIINGFQTLWEIDEKVVVESLSFSSLLSNFEIDKEEIFIVKLDIEGAELEIIDSLDSYLVSNIEQITVEFHHRLNPSLKYKTVEAIKRMYSLGFIGFTNSLSHTEVVFLNQNKVKFNRYQELLYKVYKFISFKLVNY